MSQLAPGLAIACQDVAGQVPKDGTLEARLKAAMQLTKDGHWLLSSEDENFRCAVGAVMLNASPDERERIEADLRGLKALSAMISGVPVDLSRIEVPENPLGMMAMWREIKRPPAKQGGA